MNRKDVLLQLNELFDMYCEGCLLKTTFRKEGGKSYAQSFCIHTCTVGEQIQKYGELLMRKHRMK